MAAVTNTSATSQAEIFSAINGSNGGKSPGKTATADMEDRFLTLLMTQIKNQDPLNPLDNAQVTTQLAQINTVNGIERLNSTLSKLLDGYNNAQAMQAAGIIGKQVLVPGNQLSLGANGAVGGFKLDQGVDNVKVEVLDKSGNVVRADDLGPRDAGSSTFVWDGKNGAGAAVPAGDYTFRVSATQGGKGVKATDLEFGTVNAVVRSNGGFVLDLGGLGDFSFADVQEIF